MMKLKDFDLSRLLVLELKLERCEVNQEKSKKVKPKAEAVVAPVQDTAPATSNSDVCWGCLEEGELSDMHKAFNEHDDTYADLIAYCFSLKVVEDVKSSKRKYFMCRSCITKLQEAVKFRRQLEIAQSFFNNLFPDQPEEIKHDPEIHGSLLVPTSFTEFGEDDCMIVDEVTPDSTPHSTPHPLQSNPRNTSGRLYKMLAPDVTHLQPFCKVMDEVDVSDGCHCPFCKEVFPTIIDRRRHIRQAYGGRVAKYTCEVCGRPFGTSGHMSEHVRNIHLKERTFKCNVCQESFFRRYSYVKHMNKHTEGNYQCPSCHGVFTTHNEMCQHRLKCTVTDNQSFINPDLEACYEDYIIPEVQAHNQNSSDVQAYNQNSTGSDVQAHDQNSTGSDVQAYDQDYIVYGVQASTQNSIGLDVQEFIGPEVQAYNQNTIGLDVHDYIGPDEENDSNPTCSEPDVSNIACVTPVVTGASSSSGGTYFIINHNQFQN